MWVSLCSSSVFCFVGGRCIYWMGIIRCGCCVLVISGEVIVVSFIVGMVMFMCLIVKVCIFCCRLVGVGWSVR